MRYGRTPVAAFILTLVLAASAFAEEARQFPLTTSETVENVVRWFERSGFHVSHLDLGQGSVEIRAEKDAEKWMVTVSPYSPLAVKVAASCMVGDKAGQTQVQGLWNFLAGYARGSGVEVRPSAAGVPSTVLSQGEAVVCLTAAKAKKRLQFTGVVVDREGLILCTSHNLENVTQVTITLKSGKTVEGRIIKADFDRDLALVDADGPFPAGVSIGGTARAMVTGTKLFSIGCPENLSGTVYAGFIAGPPRKVKGQYLWQASMKVYPGSSGSPVFDEQGNLAALIKGRYRGTDSTGFLIPLDTITSFVRDKMADGPNR